MLQLSGHKFIITDVFVFSNYGFDLTDYLRINMRIYITQHDQFA